MRKRRVRRRNRRRIKANHPKVRRNVRRNNIHSGDRANQKTLAPRRKVPAGNRKKLNAIVRTRIGNRIKIRIIIRNRDNGLFRPKHFRNPPNRLNKLPSCFRPQCRVARNRPVAFRRINDKKFRPVPPLPPSRKPRPSQPRNPPRLKQLTRRIIRRQNNGVPVSLNPQQNAFAFNRNRRSEPPRFHSEHGPANRRANIRPVVAFGNRQRLVAPNNLPLPRRHPNPPPRRMQGDGQNAADANRRVQNLKRHRAQPFAAGITRRGARISMQSTGHGGKHNSHPTHSLSKTE